MVVGMLLLRYLIHGRLFFLPSQFKGENGQRGRRDEREYLFNLLFFVLLFFSPFKVSRGEMKDVISFMLHTTTTKKKSERIKQQQQVIRLPAPGLSTDISISTLFHSFHLDIFHLRNICSLNHFERYL